MRLAPKLILVVTLPIAAVVAVHALWSVHHATSRLRAERAEELSVVLHALAGAAEQVIRHAGEWGDAQRLVDRVAREHLPAAEVAWRDWPAPDAADETVTPAAVGVVARTAPDDDRLVQSEPVCAADGRCRLLQLSIPAVDASALRSIELNQAITAVLLLVACAAVVAVASLRLVGRPLGIVTAQVRRIADGDLDGRVDLRSRDEIGHLGAQLNVMTERLREARQALDREAERRVAALEELRHAERLKTVGQLASGVAHQLGTPLNVVVGRARMIARGQVEGKELVESANVIVEQAQRMSNLIRHLLTYARRRPSPRMRVDLAEQVDHAIALIEPMCRKAQVTTRVEKIGGPFVVDGDTAQVEQVLANLLMNATQAMPGGGAVEVRLERVTAVHPEGSAGEYVRVSVIDAGVGMSPEVVARIFEPFFTTKDVGEGTGLGLSVAYGIVRDHGGWIEVDSRPGAGTTFRVHFPPAAA